MTSNINRGHGHIWQRPDGVKARCGGPGLCVVCQRERAILEAALATQPAEKANGERSGASLEAVAAAEINEAYWFRKTNAEAVAAILEHHEHILAGMEAKWRSASELRDELSAPPTNGTTSDRYRAELYDEVWQKARDMGYGNVTNALVELERMKAAPPAAQVHGEQPEVVALRAEVANLKDLLRYFDEHGATQAWVMRYKQALDVGARPQTCNGKRCGWCKEGTEPCHYAPPAAGVPEGISIERDMMGTMHVKVGDFYYVQVRYQHPYTDNASTRQLAERIAALIAAPTPPASEQRQAVVMPEPMHVVYGEGDESRRKEGWNDYRNELLRLNPHLRPSAPSQGGE